MHWYVYLLLLLPTLTIVAYYLLVRRAMINDNRDKNSPALI